MTITRKTSAGAAYGQLSVSAAYPSSPVAGDYHVYLVGFKPSNANLGNSPNIATPAGWTALNSIQFAGGYGSTLGDDTGNVSIFAFGREAAGGESGTVNATSGFWGDSMWGEIVPFGKTGDTWDIDSDTASDTSAGNLSLTVSNVGASAGDYLLAGFCMPTNSDDGAKFSAEAFSAAGATFGTITEIDEPNSALNTDIAGVIFGGLMATGANSGTIVATATAGGTTTNVRGGGIIVRLREIINPKVPAPSLNRARLIRSNRF